MPRTTRVSKRRKKGTVPALGMALSLAGGASAAAAAPPVDMPPRPFAPGQEITLGEEEVGDVSLATFYIFDHENAGTPRFGRRFAGGCGGCGCGGGCVDIGKTTGADYYDHFGKPGPVEPTGKRRKHNVDHRRPRPHR
ncbi:MAG: hypothetical protein ACLPKB_00835 [Xanthobacteraceae bacterium]